MTVASGRGWLVVDEGRKMPLAVFYCTYTRISHSDKTEVKARMRTYSLGLETLDENAVEERDDRLDRLERCLGSLRSQSACCSRAKRQRRAPFVKTRNDDGEDEKDEDEDEGEGERVKGARRPMTMPAAFSVSGCLFRTNNAREVSRNRVGSCRRCAQRRPRPARRWAGRSVS